MAVMAAGICWAEKCGVRAVPRTILLMLLSRFFGSRHQTTLVDRVAGASVHWGSGTRVGQTDNKGVLTLRFLSGRKLSGKTTFSLVNKLVQSVISQV